MAKSGFASRGESINHYAALRLRVTGEGNLQVNLYSLNDTGETPTGIPVEVLVPYPMLSNTSRQPTLLANTKEQRVSFEFRVDVINEWFVIERVIPFFKPIYSSFVGRG